MSKVYAIKGNNFYGIFLSEKVLEQKTAGKIFEKKMFEEIGQAREYLDTALRDFVCNEVKNAEVNIIYYFNRNKSYSKVEVSTESSFYALWTYEGLAVFDNLQRAKNAKIWLQKAKQRCFECFEDANEHAISAYNDLQMEGDNLFLKDKLPLNFVIYRSQLRKEAVEERCNL